MTTNTTHAVCPQCSAVNRFDQNRAAQATCGKCNATLIPAHPVALSSATFDRFITKSHLPVLVDFWAPWCGPCKMMAPQFEQAAAQLNPQIILAKVDTEAEQALGARHNIRSIPTLALFKNGQELARQPGAMNANDIVRWASQFT